MKTVIISQARTGSTRLPGKVMKEVMGRPLLVFHIERLLKVGNADEVVVATTVRPEDDVIAALAGEMGVLCYRGSEDDVLSRYYEAARERNADIVVRVTSDCPLIDPRIVEKIIEFFRNHIDLYDYVSNTLQRTYPRGMDTEVFSRRILEEIHALAVEEPDREHVTRYIYRHPERYRLGGIEYREDLSRHRLTVDEEDDFLLIKLLLEELYPGKPEFTMQDCLDVLARHPEWMDINAHVRQKEQ